MTHDIAMDPLYRDIILDMYRHPRNKKKIDPCTACARVVNTSCGDDIEVYVLIDNKLVTDIGHMGQGCAISQAGASLLTEALKGASVDMISTWNADTVLALFPVAIPPMRHGCALLAWHSLTQALTHTV